MFSKLVLRNSRRSRKENGLLFASFLISIVAFYIILALPYQDVMIFLKKMESDAVDRLMDLIPVFYGLTLFILFFLIYYSSKFQMECRRHEFGVYLMMGMRRGRLFTMLMAEDLFGSMAALLAGLPLAVLLSELISLITARMVGIGIIGHQVSFSPRAAVWTAAGFLLIKFAAFLILSGNICSQEIGSLLVERPEGTKKQWPEFLYALALLVGILCLAAAYALAISGVAWYQIRQMGITMILGLAGTMLFFWGLRFLIGLAAKKGKSDRRLQVFHFRQLQETVIHRSGTLAICSLLILAALCCFGAGVAIARFYGKSEQHVLDYTFTGRVNGNNEKILETLASHDLDTCFGELFEMKVGYIRTAEDYDSAFRMDTLLDALEKLEPSEDRDVLLNNLGYATYPHLISLDGYNQLLAIAGLPKLELESDEAAVYMDCDFISSEKMQMLNSILETKPEVQLDGNDCFLTGEVQTVNLVTDWSITLSFALILPEEAFERYTGGQYDVYFNGVLNREERSGGLMAAISEMNGKLDETGLSYESYLQNMGRQLFYMVAASYLTIYLAIIFLIIANTVIGVQFLMGQQKANRRYRTLIRLGADYEILCGSANRQINWYFGIPTAVAALSSLFGVRALFTGLLSSRTRANLPEMMIVSAVMIVALCAVEGLYLSAVKRSSSRYLLTLMAPEREE